MRDQNHGHAVAGELLDSLQDFASELGIERRGDLVEQHDLGLHRQRTGNGCALLLTAGHLLRVGGRLVLQAHALQRLHRDRLGIRLGSALHADLRQRDVLHHRQVREQVVALKHDANVLTQGAQVALAVMDLVAADRDAAAVDDFQPVHAAQGRALAGTALANDGHHFAGIDGKVNPAQHMGCAEAFVHVLQFNDGLHSVSFRGRDSSATTGNTWQSRAGWRNQSR